MAHVKFFIFFWAILIPGYCISRVLTPTEQARIEQKLAALPITRQSIWTLLYPKNKKNLLPLKFQEELETILKTSLLEADTEVTKLTPEIRAKLKLDNGVAAFHKQGTMLFKINPSRAGDIKENKQNDKIRMLANSHYFTHAHNIFVADGPISSEVNTLILLFHELSHASFDQMITKRPEMLVSMLRKLLPDVTIQKLLHIGINDVLEIDGDLYDLFSERYAFELEYRINRNISEVTPNWPSFYRFNDVSNDEYLEDIDKFVRRIYNIDHPALMNIPLQPTERPF
ncbi:MAG: hypothetical protein PHY93_06570 [Bacteriovorax sp.]|nr:hypothetical protein [Bacteriovorax sp.]